jgi:hypothetical protein
MVPEKRKLSRQHTTKSICSSSELVKIPNPLSMTTTLVSRKVEASAWLAEAGRSWAAGPKSLQKNEKKKLSKAISEMKMLTEF